MANKDIKNGDAGDQKYKFSSHSIDDSFETFDSKMNMLDSFVYVSDLESFTVLYVNKNGKKRWGDIVGQTCWKVIHEEQAGPCSFCKNWKLSSSDYAMSKTYVWEHLDQDTGKRTEYSESFVRWFNGKTVKLSIGSDVTELNHMDQVFDARNQVLRTIVEDSKMGICFLKAGVIVYVNQAFADLTGYIISDLMNFEKGKFTKIIHPDDRKKVSKQALLTRIGSNSTQNFTFRITTADNSVKWVNVVSNEIFYIDDYADIVTMVDVTDQKEKELEIEKQLTEVRAKNDELESIIYTISHDLRTPLFNTRGFLSELQYINKESYEYLIDKIDVTNFLQVKNFNSRAIEAADYISESLDKQKDLLNSIMKISAFYKKQVNKEHICMSKLVDDVVKNLAYRIREKKVEVVVDDLPDCYADPTIIFQVVTNLMSNAIKYRSEKDCRVKVSGMQNWQFSVYCIEDNGIGIGKHSLDKIFDLFHRVDTSHSKGDGIGLTVVKKGVRMNGGSVWVESIDGQGCKFYISLPIK